MNHAAREIVVLPSNDGDSLVWDPASSIPTLVGSLLSLAATLTVILLWIFVGGKKRRDFRYALILNLTVAEFLNALNNSVSGIAANLLKRPLYPGTACNFNGWAGQFSVQAVDFSILAISIITLLTIQLRSFIIYASTGTKTLICVSIWIVPLCTSVYAWSRNYFGPVSGNWCWITAEHQRQRYTLTHGWRFAILIVTLCTYVFVFVYMSRRLKPQDLSRTSVSDNDEDDNDESIEMGRAPHRRDDAVLSGCSTPPASVYNLEPPAPHETGHHRRNSSSISLAARFSSHLNPSVHTANRMSDRSSWGFQPSVPPSPSAIPSPSSSAESANPILIQVDFEKPLPQPSSEIAPFPSPHLPRSEDADIEKQPIPTVQLSTRQTASAVNKAKIDREIWRMILLNMYPVTYFILWIPGIANRIEEGLGHSTRMLVILQSSTQFIGLANACVYFYKEHWNDIQDFWEKMRGEKQVAVEVVTTSDRRWTGVTI